MIVRVCVPSPMMHACSVHVLLKIPHIIPQRIALNKELCFKYKICINHDSYEK